MNPKIRHYDRERGFVTIVEGGPSATVSYEALRDFKRWKKGQATFTPRAALAVENVREKLDLDAEAADKLLDEVAEQVA